MFSGFERSTIIEQAQICEWNSECTFHLRHLIYRYNPRKYNATLFGLSESTVNQWNENTEANKERLKRKSFANKMINHLRNNLGVGNKFMKNAKLFIN